MSTDHPFADSVAAYALGALDADERRAFEAHLATCARCQAELRDAQKVSAALALSAPREDPPASLRARTLAAATSQPQEPPAAPAPLRGRVSPTGVLDKPRTKGPLPRWVPIAIAASLGLAVLAGIYASLLSWQVRNLRQMVQDANDQSDRLRDELIVERQDAARLVLTVNIVTAPDARRVTLAGLEQATGASGQAFWSPTQGLVFNAERLPQLEPSRVYQLWVLRAGQAHSAGVFRVGASGAASFNAPMPRGVDGVDGLAVSLEPDPGVPAPTGPIVMKGN
jgi:anti-sigma-K factor RskA